MLPRAPSHSPSSRLVSRLAAHAASLLLLGACASGPDSQRTDCLPFDQLPPGNTPQLFAPGVVNTNAVELNGVFHPDGTEFCFTRQIDGVFVMHSTRWDEGAARWTAPEPIDVFPGQKALAVDMHFTPDGDGMFFLGGGDHGLFVSDGDRHLDLWCSARNTKAGGAGGWQPATLVPPPVSTGAREYYPTVVADGSLYFTSTRESSLGGGDIYRAQKLADGTFAEPVNLGAPINTDASEGDCYVAPDESYLILSARRPDSVGSSDLYVSFRGDDGGWGEPIHMGDGINTEVVEFCPMVSPDGRFLFFTRRYGDSWAETTNASIFWMDAAAIESFRP